MQPAVNPQSCPIQAVVYSVVVMDAFFDQQYTCRRKPIKDKGPLVAKYQLVDLLRYSVSFPLKGSRLDLLVRFLKQEIVLAGYIMLRTQ
jgi:hypothetical protein